MTYIFVAVLAFLVTLFFLPEPMRWRDIAAALGMALFFVVGMVML